MNRISSSPDVAEDLAKQLEMKGVAISPNAKRIQKAIIKLLEPRTSQIMTIVEQLKSEQYDNNVATKELSRQMDFKVD